MRILVSGGAGEFSREIVKYNKITNNHIVFPVSKNQMNVSIIEDIHSTIKRYDPDIFIHAGALTRPMSEHTENPQLSISSNIIGTSNVVISCMKRGIKLIYISTDYVYPGNRGNYSETDPLLPVNHYGWSKLGGECAVMLYDNSLILRMAMTPRPFSHKAALIDCYKSSIYIDDAAKTCMSLLDQKGIINVGGKSQSIYDFARESVSDIEKVNIKDISDVKMAKNSTMNTDKMRLFSKND